MPGSCDSTTGSCGTQVNVDDLCSSYSIEDDEEWKTVDKGQCQDP